MIAVSPLHSQSSTLSDVGKNRSLNEDACLEHPFSGAGLWVVADGMGGHEAGEVASRMIVESLREVLPPTNLGQLIDEVEGRLLDVNRALLALAAQAPQPMTIGTTVAALLSYHGQGACLWVGDSRVYRFRAGKLERLTTDHSEVEELIQAGMLRPEDAESHPAANVVTRAVGGEPELVVDVKFQELRAGDRYLLCSDGLSKELNDMEIATFMPHGLAAELCRTLVDQALAHGGHDNTTVVVVDFNAPS